MRTLCTIAPQPPTGPRSAPYGASGLAGSTSAQWVRDDHDVHRSIVAVNTAPDSENRMHGDEAQRFGFAGGLVPGVDVLGYLAHEAVERWGAGWLGDGRLDGRLVAPVYDGEAIDVVADDDGDVRRAEVRGPDGSVRATATLTALGDDRSAWHARVDGGALATVPLLEPSARPDATAERLEPGTVLGVQRATFRADRAPHHLDELSEHHPAFREEHLAHPAWLLRFANWALSSTVRLGPWIHVSSDVALLAPVRDGDVLETRARVRDRFERKGHEMVDLDVAMLVDDAVVAVVDHRAIWRPRQRS